MDLNLAKLIALIVVMAGIGSCTHTLSKTDQMRLCIQQKMEFVNGDCVTPGSGVR